MCVVRKETRERSVIVSGYCIKTLKYICERLLCEQFARQVKHKSVKIKKNTHFLNILEILIQEIFGSKCINSTT